MAKILHFEELQCWQRAREMANVFYEITSCQSFQKDFELRNQLRRAAGSAMHNIAEGFESGTDPEFARFLRMARRSASEVQSELYLALDQKYISDDQRMAAHQLADEVKKLVNGFVKYLKTNEQKQPSSRD